MPTRDGPFLADAQQQRDALVRAVAGALGDEKVKDAVLSFQEAGGYRVLSRVLPFPRTDLGKVSAQSVILPPKGAKISAAVACNACKVLLAALSNDDSDLRKAVVDDLEKTDGIERLVCALANFKEMPVRRNAAVCLAKTMHIKPETKDRIRDLRGLEMITTLGDRLMAK